jgi:hypothetical protein
MSTSLRSCSWRRRRRSGSERPRSDGWAGVFLAFRQGVCWSCFATGCVMRSCNASTFVLPRNSNGGARASWVEE